ncbi:MAG: 3-dehydroquinate synthase family protein [bacterium JZ-2024 1]
MRRIILLSDERAVVAAAGKMVAEWLGAQFADYEVELERLASEPVSLARQARGRRALRDMERELVADLLTKDDIVVAATPPAASIGMNLLSERPTEVFILTTPDSGRSPNRRAHPSRRGAPISLHETHHKFRHTRARIHVIHIADHSPGAIAYKVIATLDQPAPRVIPNEVHPVIIAPNGYPRLLEWLKAQSGGVPENVVLLLHDVLPAEEVRHLLRLHSKLGFVKVLGVVRVPSGERMRTVETLARLWRSISRFKNLNKKDLLIAIGPQTVIHLSAALAASTLGGIRLAVVPTTLSAMLDSGAGFSGSLRVRSSGLPLHFNYFPTVSLIDPLYVLFSGEDDLRTGYLELIRVALVGDAVLFDRIDQWSQEGRPFAYRFGELSWILERALRVKLRLLEQDTLATERALVLRLGEPFYSALIVASRATYSGAYAGASALALSLALSRSLGALSAHAEERVFSLFRRLGLPVGVPKFLPFEDFYEALRLDPYAGNDRLSLPLPTRIGSTSVFQLPLNSFRAALTRVWTSLLPYTPP